MTKYVTVVMWDLRAIRVFSSIPKNLPEPVETTDVRQRIPFKFPGRA